MNLRIVVLSITILLAAGFVNRVLACSCPGIAFGPDYRQRADAVFVGKVVAKQKSDAVEKDGVKVTLAVERVWKGTAFERTLVYTGATGDLYPFTDSCAIPFLMGQRYIVFAYRRDGQLVTDVCAGSGGFPYADKVIKQLGPGNALGQDTKPQPSARDIARKVSLRCSPSRLYLGDTVTLNMSVPHGRDLAILGPDNKFFWLRSWEPNDEATTASWYAFEKMKLFRIVTAEAKGRVNADDEAIFTKTGWYRIRVSYNLETDDGTPIKECKVYYTHRRRSAQVSPEVRRFAYRA